MKSEIIYSNKANFEKTLDNLIKRLSSSSLHFLADFDRTLTKSFSSDWEKRPSLISVLRKEWYLSEEYSKQAYALFDKYHPIEADPQIDLEEKKKQMSIWWESHLDLLVKSWLNLSDISKVVDSWIIQLRDGCEEMFEMLNSKNIPIVIISANWLGTDSIKLYLQKNDLDYPNIHIISNSFNYDSNWYVTSYNYPVIHTFNKDETVLSELPEIYDIVKNRKDVILLWDSLWDHHMIDGFDYDNLLKIGFLNENIQDNLEEYQKRYDVLITNDWDINFVNNLLKKIL